MNDELNYGFVSGDALAVSFPLIFSDKGDAEFRIICAYRAMKLNGNPDLFDQFAMRYGSKFVANTVSRYRRSIENGESS